MNNVPQSRRKVKPVSDARRYPAPMISARFEPQELCDAHCDAPSYLTWAFEHQEIRSSAGTSSRSE